MITLSGVSKTYKGRQSPALRDVSLSIERGEMLAVIGANGAGKSTLMGILAGILEPTAGRVMGDPVRSVVLQQPALDPLLTMRENATLFARVFGVGRDDRKSRIEAFAETTGLTDRLDDRVDTLSGGLMRRVDLLRAVMVGPELLLLDEPTAGLDRQSSPEILRLVTRFRDEHGMGVVLVTHTMDDAALGDRVLVLHAGEVLRQEHPRSLVDELGDVVVVETADGQRRFVSKDEVRVVTAELVDQGLAFAVREPGLGDAYDRIVESRG